MEPNNNGQIITYRGETQAPIAQLVECPLRGTGDHGFDPKPRHTKIIKQVAQRATIAHLSPMCQGKIVFKKSGDIDVLDAQGQLTP